MYVRACQYWNPAPAARGENDISCEAREFFEFIRLKMTLRAKRENIWGCILGGPDFCPDFDFAALIIIITRGGGLCICFCETDVFHISYSKFLKKFKYSLVLDAI